MGSRVRLLRTRTEGGGVDSAVARWNEVPTLHRVRLEAPGATDRRTPANDGGSIALTGSSCTDLIGRTLVPAATAVIEIATSNINATGAAQLLGARTNTHAAAVAALRSRACVATRTAVGLVRVEIGTTGAAGIRGGGTRAGAKPRRARLAARCAVLAPSDRPTISGVDGAVVASVAAASAGCPTRLADAVARARADLSCTTRGVAHPVSTGVAMLGHPARGAALLFSRCAIGAGIRGRKTDRTGLGALRAGSLASAGSGQLKLRGAETAGKATRGRGARRHAIWA